jgi:hypothetical protein
MTSSAYLRTNMITSGQFIATSPSSVVRFCADRLSLKVLPVDLPMRPWPLAIVTLKNRTLSPVVARFIEYLSDFTRPMRVRGPVAARWNAKTRPRCRVCDLFQCGKHWCFDFRPSGTRVSRSFLRRERRLLAQGCRRTRCSKSAAIWVYRPSNQCSRHGPHGVHTKWTAPHRADVGRPLGRPGAWLFCESDPTATRPAPGDTVLFAAVCTRQPSEAVFLVDLIRLVLFLIDPVECNGGVIDLNLKPTLYRSRAVPVPPSAVDSGDRPDLTASNWPTPHLPTSRSHNQVGRRFFDV